MSRDVSEWPGPPLPPGSRTSIKLDDIAFRPIAGIAAGRRVVPLSAPERHQLQPVLTVEAVVVIGLPRPPVGVAERLAGHPLPARGRIRDPRRLEPAEPVAAGDRLGEVGDKELIL